MTKFEQCAQNLVKKGYQVECFQTKEEARDFLNSKLDGTTIGIGGSQTVNQMGLFEALSTHNTIFWHDRKPEDMSVLETRMAACKAPVYIMSANALSVEGDIVNIDACGNRIAALSFGPEDVYFVVGVNKIADDCEAAIYRARNVAAPLNAKRLNRKTPCAVKADKCYDCNSPERICRNFSVLKECPFGPKYHVILINEELGF